eukprot:g44880.t1
MASKQQLQRLTEETTCSICLDFFTNPVVLECGHNFCRSCITQVWEKKEINSCPECREVFPERNLRDKIKSSLDYLTEKKSKVHEMELNQKQKISEASRLQTYITSEFTKMHQILSEKEQRLLRDLRKEEERILDPMEENLRKIQENLNSIEEKLSKLQKQMEQKDKLFLKVREYIAEAACRKR